MKPSSSITKDLPLRIAGSAMYGRYDKISVENTYNMILSDNWLVPYAGYKVVARFIRNGEGRGIYTSTIQNMMFVVVNNAAYSVDQFLNVSRIGTLGTSSGDVFIAENNGGQIAFCDKQSIYIYNYDTATFSTITITPGESGKPFQPGYITFQDGYFITVNTLTNEWRLSSPNDGTMWPLGAANEATIQTKPTKAVGVIRFPGKGNLLFVLGQTVTESWYDTGTNLFPYQKNTFYNIDYGCLNPATIATEKDFIAWLGINEKAGPVIMVSDGGEVKQLETDGINFKLANLKNPSNSYAFMFRQDGHVFYQITFPDPEDNLTLVYDFSTSKFFTMTDELMNYHIAKRVAFFNDTYYFISINDGFLYEMSTQILNYEYEDTTHEIPRIRVCQNIRLPDSSGFIINSLAFTLDQGNQRMNIPQRIDMSISVDGGTIFSSYVGYELNRAGKHQNRFTSWPGCYTNDFVAQFRFIGLDRFTATDGIVSVYQ